MIQIRNSEDRGHFDFGWLKTFHTFSFSEYFDPKFMGFRTLRVINEDWIRAGEGFPTHSHKDMEIITYVLEGALSHKDSMGNGSVISPGDVQYMSAGSGVTHSEFNHSKEGATHLMQIWILPSTKGAKPTYDQKRFSGEEKKNKLKLVVSKDGKEGSIAVRQDVSLFSSLLFPDQVINYEFAPARFGWIQMASGSVTINGNKLTEGDGAAIGEEARIEIRSDSIEQAEFLLFDLN